MRWRARHGPAPTGTQRGANCVGARHGPAPTGNPTRSQLRRRARHGPAPTGNPTRSQLRRRARHGLAPTGTQRGANCAGGRGIAPPLQAPSVEPIAPAGEAWLFGDNQGENPATIRMRMRCEVNSRIWDWIGWHVVDWPIARPRGLRHPAVRRRGIAPPLQAPSVEPIAPAGEAWLFGDNQGENPATIRMRMVVKLIHGYGIGLVGTSWTGRPPGAGQSGDRAGWLTIAGSPTKEDHPCRDHTSRNAR